MNSVYILFNSKIGHDTVFEFTGAGIDADALSCIETDPFRSLQVRACESVLRILMERPDLGEVILHPRDYYIKTETGELVHESSVGYGTTIPLLDIEDIYETSFSIHLLSDQRAVYQLQEHYEMVSLSGDEQEWMDQIDTHLTMYYKQKNWLTPRFFMGRPVCSV